MAALGLPVPPAFVLPVELCAAIVDGEPMPSQKLAEGLTEGIEFLEERHRQTVRRPAPSAAGVGALRRRAIDARHAGHRARCRLHAGRGPRPRAHDRPSALCLRLPPPLSRKLWQRRARDRSGAVCSDGSTDWSRAEGVDSEQALDGEALERLAGVLPAGDRGRRRSRSPRRSDGATRGRGRGGLPLVDERSRRHLSPARSIWRICAAPPSRFRRWCSAISGPPSGAGVAFSRDPSTGAAQPVIDVLFGSQGEDVVSGRRTPETEEAIGAIAARGRGAIARRADAARARIRRRAGRRIHHRGRQAMDPADARGKAHAAGGAALRHRLRQGGPHHAGRRRCRRLNGVDLDKLATQAPGRCRTSRSRAAPARRRASPSDARHSIPPAPRVWRQAATRSFSCAPIPAPPMSPDLRSSAGIVTAVGGRTAHAALVARQMDKPCIVGCAALDGRCRRATARGWRSVAINEGDWLSIDGEAGHDLSRPLRRRHRAAGRGVAANRTLARQRRCRGLTGSCTSRSRPGFERAVRHHQHCRDDLRSDGEVRGAVHRRGTAGAVHGGVFRADRGRHPALGVEVNGRRCSLQNGHGPRDAGHEGTIGNLARGLVPTP